MVPTPTKLCSCSKRFGLLPVLASLLLGACGLRTASSGAQGDTLAFSHASLLTVVDDGRVMHADVHDPWHAGQTLQHLAVGPAGGESVLRPLQRVVVFTTAHCQLLEYLGLADRVVGVCDVQYILIPDIQQRVKAGRIADCGNSMSPDVEKIVSLHPDAIIVSPYEGASYGRLEKLGIPLIMAADYMETSALGRAEWMRFYGRLFGQAQRADSLYHVVDSTYGALKAYAARLPKGRSILTERKTGAVWYVPGGQSTVGTLLADANSPYAFAADGHSGSLALSFEQVADRAGQADVWAFKFNGQQPMTRADLLREYHGYKVLRAFRTGEVYECNASQVPYFEEVSFRPDYLLREMLLLAHPGAPLGTLRYYRKMPAD